MEKPLEQNSNNQVKYTMKQRIPLLLSIILALCLMQGAAAADFVETVADIDPASGDLAPGEQVIVHVIVKLTGSGDNTFDTNDELEAYTELDDQQWDYKILVNSQGIPKQSTSRILTLLGWDLAYPDSNEVTVDYTLSGKVPTVAQTSDVTLFRLRQLDVNGNVPFGGELLIKPTVFINPEMQFVTADTSSATVAKGDDLYITGNAEDNPTAGVAIWIFGKNCASYAIETVEENGAFDYKFGNTENLAAGQYFVIVQHPMNNSHFDLAPQAGNPAPGQAALVRPILDAEFADPDTGNLPPIFILEGTGSLQGSDAATALISAINSAEIDDTYCELSFMVEDPWIIIDTIGDRYVSAPFTITGTTNLAVGDTLIVEVTSLSSLASSSSGTAIIAANDTNGVNTWQFAVDPTSYTPDDYIISVENSKTGETATQTFTILEAEPTNYVTITASGNSSYYIGEDIVLSGINTDSNTTWLFITGPNLASKGGSLNDPRDGINTAAVGSQVFPNGTLDSGAPWSGENVSANNTWEYAWDTSGVNLDAGTYTIYAVTTATNQDDLATQDTTYATAPIIIKKPFVKATTSQATVAQGDDLYITGNAEGDPTPGIAIWILGKNKVERQTETVEDNGAFSYKFTGTDTLASGQYFVVVQHPMYNDQFDLDTVVFGGVTYVYRPVLDPFVLSPLFILEGSGSLQGSDAATALVYAMDSPDIDDTYYKLTFMIEEPWIMIDAIGDKYVGETFIISGTTNLAAGNNLTVEVTPLNTTVPVTSGTARVTTGDTEDVNIWEFTVDTSSYTPDDYIVTVESGQTITQAFTVLPTNQNPNISINAIQNSPYYLGEDILISGINNDSEITWLFVNGPNLPETGGSFINPHTGVNSATNANGLPVSPFYPNGYLDSDAEWEGVNVATDNTWECKWKTTGADLDAGIYTIYAVTTATDKDDLSSHSANYAIASIALNDPFVTATTSSSVVAKGDDLSITGNAENNPTQGVAIWIFGKNYAFHTTETVEENGAFDYSSKITTDLTAGQYFAVLQHPMNNEQFDLVPQEGNPAAGQTAVVRPILDASRVGPTGLFPPAFLIEGTGSLQGYDAYAALISAMNNPEIDDTYFRFTFIVEEPWIMIDTIGEKYVSRNFTISGTTNLAIGDSLNVEVAPSSFTPNDATQNSTSLSSSGTVPVRAGEREGANVWEYAVDTSSLTPDEYLVTVEGVEAAQTTTQTFTILQTEPTPTPVPTPQPIYDGTLSFSSGWNLISTPVDSPNINASPFLYKTAYAYNATTGTYEEVPLADIVPGEGYWIGAFSDTEIECTGVPLTEYQKELSKGWNLIGGLGIATETTSINATPDALSGPLYQVQPERLHIQPGICFGTRAGLLGVICRTLHNQCQYHPTRSTGITPTTFFHSRTYDKYQNYGYIEMMPE